MWCRFDRCGVWDGEVEGSPTQGPEEEEEEEESVRRQMIPEGSFSLAQRMTAKDGVLRGERCGPNINIFIFIFSTGINKSSLSDQTLRELWPGVP